MNIVPSSNDNNSSPFDRIRGYRADGSEFWTARELMKWLGYKSWQKGEIAFERAIKSLENQGHDITEHVIQVDKDSHSNGLGALQIIDYELSRLACYMVAMNSDPSKDMVAMAQGYFGKMARIAELSITQSPTIPAVQPHILAVQIADSIRHVTDTLDDNPRLAQLLIDLSISGIVEQKALALNSETPLLRGVAEIAAEMKLPITIKNRGDLGKFIVSAGFKPQTEKRLVNGAMRDVNCYHDTPELRNSIAEFFN